MLDIGAFNTGNGIDYGDRAAEDGSQSMTVGFFHELDSGGLGATIRNGLGKFSSGSNLGWTLGGGGISNNEVYHLRIGTGASIITAGSATDLSDAATLRSVVCAWDGSNANFFINGSADGTPALSATLSPVTGDIAVGEVNGYNGHGGKMGHCVLWDGVELNASQAAQFNTGDTLPELGSVRFWTRLKDKTANAELPGSASPSETGTVSDHADSIDDYFPVAAGGFALFIAEYWAPLLIGSELLGHAFNACSISELRGAFQVFQRRCNIRIPDLEFDELKAILNVSLGRRPVFSC